MPQGFLDIVEPGDTLLVSEERRYETKKPKNCKLKPQLRKRLCSPKTTNKRRGHSTGLEIGLVGTTMMKPVDHLLMLNSSHIMELRCLPPNLTSEETFGQVTRIIPTPIDVLSKETTRITTTTDAMTTKQDHQTSQTKINLGIAAVTITFHARLQRRDKTHSSWISADNSDPIHLIHRCIPVSESKT